MKPKQFLFDFETRSGKSLPDVGVKNYLSDPQAGIVCMSYKINDQPVQLWLPGSAFPMQYVNEDYRFYAFNAQFDWQVWNKLGPLYGLPPLPIELCVDVMALCGRYTFPQALDFVGRVLNLEVQKRPSGKRLMKKICSPPFEHTPGEVYEFYKYCLEDTEAMYHLLHSLPSDKLSAEEQKIWELTVKINQTGIPIDHVLVGQIISVIEYYKKREVKKLPAITEGFVRTPNQVAKIVEYCYDHDLDLPDLTKETVVNALKQEDLQPSVRKVLQMRQEFGRSSIAKYAKLKSMVHKGRIYENLRYHAASTGRFGGLGFQAHNLPRDTVKDVEKTVDSFYDWSALTKNPMASAKALIRSTITAPKGKALAVADYSSIEYVILSWVAGEEEALYNIRSGIDPYKVLASGIFQVPYDDVNKDERFFGKVTILGAGYGLGAKGFLAYAEGYGLTIHEEDAHKAIMTYRSTHAKVKKFWFDVKDAAVSAIRNPGTSYKVSLCAFYMAKDKTGKDWLVLNLPSGRNLFYCEPEVGEDLFGPIPTHMGINSYSKSWQRLKLIPGRITENIVQALARDILTHGKIRLDTQGYKIILSVHDEIICEIDEGFSNSVLACMIEQMCVLPDWAKGMPLKAEGEVMQRYGKL